MKAMLFLSALLIAGCGSDEKSHNEGQSEFEIERHSSIEYITSFDGGSYRVESTDCVDNSSEVEITHDGKDVYSGDRYCSGSFPLYSFGMMSAKAYGDIEDETLRLRIRGGDSGQLCNIGDLKISFGSSGFSDQVVMGVVSCNHYLAIIDIPSGDYRGAIEFNGYRGEHQVIDLIINAYKVES